MLGFNLPTYLQRLKMLAEQCANWATRSKYWAQMALTGVGITQIEAGTETLVVGGPEDVFKYYIVNDDLHTVTFWLTNVPIVGTSFQIRNNGFGIVQIQAWNEGIINSPGTLILRGHGSVVSLVALRAEENGIPAMWDLIGDVQPL
jgi:hypothetical protein